MRNARLGFLAFAVLYLFASPAEAGPLNEARITKIINDVRVVESSKTHSAALQEVISDDVAVRTGVKSRSGLLFQDDTLTRLGPETMFGFKTGTREMTLIQGAMLLQVPKGLGGARIHTAAVTASVTGTTIMMEHLPNEHIKVLVLEGSLRLALDGKLGQHVMLRPGQMIMMRPNTAALPRPVTVDLKRVVKTSPLVRMGKGKPLPSIPLIAQAIEHQELAKAQNTLVTTRALVKGNSVVDAGSLPSVVTTADHGANASASTVSNGVGADRSGNVAGSDHSSALGNVNGNGNAYGHASGVGALDPLVDLQRNPNAIGHVMDTSHGHGQDNPHGNPHGNPGPTPAPTPPPPAH
ncbi:MAG: FecR domain-containing protein [Chthoniobacterales bacterium]